MGDLLEKHLSFLQTLLQANVKQRKALLQYVSCEQMHAINSMMLNILKGNIPLSLMDKTRLHRHRFHIRTLAAKEGFPNRIKKEVLIRHHSILPICIAALLDYLHHEQAYGSPEQEHIPTSDRQPGKGEDSDSGTTTSTDSDSDSGSGDESSETE